MGDMESMMENSTGKSLTGKPLIDEKKIRRIVEEVVNGLKGGVKVSTVETVAKTVPRRGVFPDMESAVAAAKKAFQELRELSLDTRSKMIEALRDAVRSNLHVLSKMAVEETGFGRVEDKIKKIC